MSNPITQIIASQGLRPGDPMIDVKGEVIADSVVLDSTSFLHRDGERYRLIGEKPIAGERYDISLSADAIAAIKGVAF